MNDNSALFLAIFGALLTWTGTVVALVNWLNGKFRHLEKTFYKEMDNRRRDTDRRFSSLGIRVQRLEIKAFGFASGQHSAFEILEDPSDDPLPEQ